MDQQKFIKQSIDFNKNVFNNLFNAAVMFQDQAERVSRTFLDQVTWIPEEGKSLVNEWIEAYKKERENYKTKAEAGFKQMEAFFGAAK
ncbi:MAG: hypothetical protein ACOZF0_04385 [Thermodesulfobacteriota bacterium]